MNGNDGLDGWITDLTAAIEPMHGAQPVAALSTLWSTHAAGAAVVTTVFGPFDSGKSALLKRLLVELGTQVPDWVRVGGQPTTFLAQSVESAGLRFVDTPGLATGNDRHTAEALRAAGLTDALLFVLPPNLLTSDAEQMLAVLDGSATGGVHLPDHAIIAVIARADEIFGDPEDEPDVFRRSVERKRAELRRQLARARQPLPDIDIVAVAADAGGRVADRPPTSVADYRRGPWDGVAELADLLRTLPPRRAELRHHAGVRFWSRAGRDAELTGEERLATLGAGLHTAQGRNAALDGYLADLSKLDERQQARLRSELLAELDSIVNTLQANAGADASSLIGERLLARVRSWQARALAALDELAEEAKVELTRRSRLPSTQELLEVFAPLLGKAGPPSGIGPRQWLPMVSPAVEFFVDQSFRQLMGMGLSDARPEVELFRRMADSDKLAEYLEIGKFISAEQAESAKSILKGAERVTAVVPMVTQLAKLYLDEKDETKRAQLNYAELQQLRDRLDPIADELAEAIVNGDGEHGWAAEVEFLCGRLSRLRADALIAELTDQQDALREQLARLRALLTEPPPS